MVRKQCKWTFLTLAAAIFAGGCAQVPSVRPGWFQKENEEPQLPPPTPAPPLLIPGSANPKPESPQTKQAHYETPAVAPALIPVTPPSVQQASNFETITTRLSAIYQRANNRFQAVSSYRARVRRRELVQGKQIREETIMQQYRRKPWSLAWQWLDGPEKGHRIAHVRPRDGRKAHWVSPKPDLPLLKKNRVTTIPLDDPKLQKVSRLPFDKIGLETWITRFGKHVGRFAANEPNCGEFHYLGFLKRPEFETKVEAVMHVLPAGCDPFLPKGGQRLWFFDAKHHLPVLIITHNDQGREVGYFCFDRLQCDSPAGNDLFNLPTND